MSGFRRLLVISHNAVSESRNNGKTISSLFENWPSENFAQLYFNRELPESKNFRIFFRITATDAARSFLLRRFNVNTRRVKSVEIVRNGSKTESAVHLRLAKIVNRTSTAKRMIRDLLYSTNAWFSPSFSSWLRDFSPQAIFFVGGDAIFSFKIAEYLCDRFDIPLYLYITDDYVVNAKPAGSIGALYLNRLKLRYAAAFSRSKSIFVIGEEMSNVFRDTFGIASIPIMNAVDQPTEVSFVEKYASIPRAFRIVYAGGLHLDRDRSIMKFGELMKKVMDQTGTSMELAVYTSQQISTSKKLKFERAGVKCNGAVYGSELSAILRTSDFLLHVESFREQNMAKTMLSVSTKLPEYMFSRTCIIGYGPSQVASIKLLRDNNIGVTIDEFDDDEAAVRKIELMLSSALELQRLSDRAYEYAALKLSGSVARSRLEIEINGERNDRAF